MTDQLRVGGTYVPPTYNSDVERNYLKLPVLSYFGKRESWRDNAKCLGKTELLNDFFDGCNGESKVSKKAKEFCRDCPVKLECLRYALDNNIIDGIYGGVGPGERARNKNKYKNMLEEAGMDYRKKAKPV